MKEVKQFSKSYIFISALYVVLGVALLAWPMMSVKMICYGLAVAMIVMPIILNKRAQKAAAQDQATGEDKNA